MQSQQLYCFGCCCVVCLLFVGCCCLLLLFHCFARSSRRPPLFSTPPRRPRSAPGSLGAPGIFERGRAGLLAEPDGTECPVPPWRFASHPPSPCQSNVCVLVWVPSGCGSSSFVRSMRLTVRGMKGNNRNNSSSSSSSSSKHKSS